MMVYLKIASFFFIGITLILTIFQFLKRVEWWIRIADFIHLQLTVISFVSWMYLVIFLELSVINLLFILVGIPLTVIHLVIMIPYTFLYPKQVKNSREENLKNKISILEANVLMYNKSYAALLDSVNHNDPDILVAIETDMNWEKAMDILTPDYPYQIKYPKDNTYGLHLYSKLPLKDVEIKFLVEDDVPSFHAKVQLRNNQLVNLIVLHPKPPSPTENYLSLERDAELIIIGKKIAEFNEPVIVTGDLNDVAWSHSSRLFKRISGLLDPRIGRGFFNTFHAQYPLIRWPLDHVFHSKHFLVGEIKRLSRINSDHFPIYITLYLESEKGGKLNDEPESVSAVDLAEIEDKIDRIA